MRDFCNLWPIALLATVVVGAPGGGADAAKPDAAKKDIEKVQGSWTMVFAADSGRALPAADIANHQLVMRGDKYTLFKEEDKIHDHGTFTLDPTRCPRAIDITEDQGPNKGTTNRGIYLLDGNTFIVCYNLPHMGRPTEFTSRPGSTVFLFIYKRDRP
jgi:uncharacterized protein (TIGR03067 family)